MSTRHGAPAAPAAPARALWLRRGIHALAIAAGWALFFWGWQRVLARGTDFSELRALMVGAAVVVPVVTVSWILHNRGIHRRKGPRKRVIGAVLDYRVDFNGREVVADFRALALAQRVDIVVDGGFKRYHAGPPRPLRPSKREGRPEPRGAETADLQDTARHPALQARSAIDQASQAAPAFQTAQAVESIENPRNLRAPPTGAAGLPVASALEPPP